MNPIPLSRPTITDDDALAVVEALRSDWSAQGAVVERFEQEVASYSGARFAVAFSSSTAALHASCAVAGVGPGRTLWTSSLALVSSANCARYCWGAVDFVDVDLQSGNMDTASLEEKLNNAEQQGRLPQAIMPFHFAGQSAEMGSIRQLASRFDITVIENATMALGGLYQGDKIGSCKHSDMVVFGFQPTFPLTTYGGGVVVTNRVETRDKLLRFRMQGFTGQVEQVELGFDYALADILAALGVSQMKRVDTLIAGSSALADWYDRALAGTGMEAPWRHPDVVSSWSHYPVRFSSAEQCAVAAGKLKDAGIGSGTHFPPVHLQPYYRKLGFKTGDLPATEAFASMALSLPLYPGLQADEQAFVIEVLKSA
jgi:dTDP-4-amino-4,6-dideoxygalactose transaminase